MRTLSHYHAFPGGSQDSHVTDMWQSCYTGIPQSKQEALLARETHFIAQSQFLKVISDEPEDSIMPHFQCVMYCRHTSSNVHPTVWNLCPGLSLSAAVCGFFVDLYIFYLNFHALLSAYPVR